MKRLLTWYGKNLRPLPWRAEGTTPWGILVSEVMLQQTPASRVAPVWTEWMKRWPTADALAGTSTAEVLHAWGRLGYPRRALRLHEAAGHLVTVHAGEVPSDTESLRAIPGVGEYTAAALQAFAFHQPAVVLDVNIRRVLSRVIMGVDLSTSHITRAERELGAVVLAEADHNPAWNAAIMEFGALVCTARNPRCEVCPLRDICAWRAAGYPEPAKKRRGQAWEGTDRQVRGKVMAHLRSSEDFLAPETDLVALWPDEAQLRLALATLTEDGLIHQRESGIFVLGAP